MRFEQVLASAGLIFPEWPQTALAVGADALGRRRPARRGLLFFVGLFAAIAIWRFDWEEPRR